MTVSHLIEMLTKLNPKTEITVWINGCDYNCDKEFDFEGDYVGGENDGYSLEVKPQEREEAIAFFKDMNECTYGNLEAVEMAIKAIEQEPKAVQFAKWVATEIFDENWEYNKDAFAEIACRKLAKLGIVRAKGDEWELVESPESEVQDAD